MTGRLLRTFPMVGADGPEGQKRIVWPMFKWSPDEKFLGRVTPGQQISVYEVPSMGLLGKKSVKIEGVVDFEWCPLNDRERDELETGVTGGEVKKGKPTPVRENIIAFWTPEVVNQPARVSLMTLPSRTTLRSKNLFNVHDVRPPPSLARADVGAGQDPLAVERGLPLRQGGPPHQDEEDAVLQPRALPSA